MNFTSFLGMSNDSRIFVLITVECWLSRSWVFAFAFFCCYNHYKKLMVVQTLWDEPMNKSNKNLGTSLPSKLDYLRVLFSELWRGLLQGHTVQKKRKKKSKQTHKHRFETVTKTQNLILFHIPLQVNIHLHDRSFK